ncbi:MAG: hypothetical protein ABSA15_06260, partial [Thermoplasmata archaeon]
PIPSTELPQSPPRDGSVPMRGRLVPGVDDGSLAERRRQWAIERARFEATHPPPTAERANPE